MVPNAFLAAAMSAARAFGSDPSNCSRWLAEPNCGPGRDATLYAADTLKAAAATVRISSARTRICCRHSRRNSRHAHRATARLAGTPPPAGPGRTGRSRNVALIAAVPA